MGLKIPPYHLRTKGLFLAPENSLDSQTPFKRDPQGIQGIDSIPQGNRRELLGNSLRPTF